MGAEGEVWRRKANLAGGCVALLMLFSTAALADCMDDAERCGFTAQQNGGELPVRLKVRDPREQPPRSSASPPMAPAEGCITRSPCGGRAGNEAHCLRMLGQIRRGP